MAYGKTTFMMLLGITFILWVAGYHSAFMDTQGNIMIPNGIGGTVNIGGFSSVESIAFLILTFLGVIGAASGIANAASAGSGGSFATIYTIPIAIALVFVYIIFAPLSFINEVGLPSVVKVFVLMFFGGMILMSLFDWVRGGDY